MEQAQNQPVQANPLQQGIQGAPPSQFDLPGDRKEGTVAQPFPKKKSKAPMMLFLFFLMLLLCGGAAVGGYLYGKDKCECPKCEDIDTGSDTEDDMYSCSSDEDCMVVQDGCCPCNEGGKNTSINKNYETEWEDLDGCEVCPDEISDEWTCGDGVEAKCVEGKCKLEEDEVATKECVYEDNSVKISFDIPKDWECTENEEDDPESGTSIVSDLLEVYVGFPFDVACGGDEQDCEQEEIYKNADINVLKTINENSDDTVYAETRGYFLSDIEALENINVVLRVPNLSERDLTTEELDELKFVLDTVVIEEK